MKPLRLLAIIEARTITGPAKNLLEFAQSAVALGVETHVVTFLRGEDSNLFIETARSRGIPICPIPEQSRYDRSVLAGLHELVSRLEPDVIQTHAVKSHFLVRRSGLPQRTPWVAFHHGYTWTSRRARMYNLLDRWSLRTAAKVVTVSRTFRTELQEKGVPSDRIEIVHNAIRADWAAEARRPENAAALRAALNIAPNGKLILIVGRLSLEKDHITLLRAVDRLRTRLAPNLLIVGEGPERLRIEQEMNRLDLANHVIFTGQQDSAEPYYGVADVAVLSSLTEGSPNALLEAMAAGVPVVATTVGGIPEIVAHGESALLVQPGDAAGMADSLAKLLVDDPSLVTRLVTRSVELVRERHTPAARAKLLVEIYRAVSGAQNR